MVLKFSVSCAGNARLADPSALRAVVPKPGLLR